MGIKHLKFLIISLLFLALLGTNINAVSIGVSPSVLKYEDVLKGGFAQKTLYLSSDAQSNLSIEFELFGETADWISFGPIDLSQENVTISAGNPYILNVIVEPPVDTQNGVYSGQIRVITNKLQDVESGKGVGIRAAFMVDVTIEVGGEEIIRCTAGGFGIPHLELDDALALSYTLENLGNVNIDPNVFIDLFDINNNEVLKLDFQSTRVRPTLKNTFEEFLANNLPTGQYFAHISVPLCNAASTLTFTITEPGVISDDGTLIQIKNPNWGETDTIIPINAVFKNTGPRTVRAKFIGHIQEKAGDIVKLIDTDFINIKPGETNSFETFFKTNNIGQYIIYGKIKYNNKITFEKASVLNIRQKIEGEGVSIGWSSLIFFGVIIALLLIIIKKKKIILRKRHKSRVHKF